MKYIIIITLMVYTNYSRALVVWPGSSAPCNTTLDACADGSPIGETIEIHTNAVIDENVTSSRATSLVAGAGFKPVFATDRHVEITGFISSDTTITISGLTMIKGRIAYGASGSPGTTTTLNITNNHIMDNKFNTESVRISNFGTHTLVMNVAFNQINYTAPFPGIDRNGGIGISNGSFDGGSTSGEITGSVFNNRIQVFNQESVGIGLYEMSNNHSDLDVSSNQMIGGHTAAMYINKNAASSGISRLDFAHNAIYSNQVDSRFKGMLADVLGGEIEINAVNNTVLGAYDGFNFQTGTTGVIELDLYNNLIAFSEAALVINSVFTADSTITMNNDANLIYDNLIADPDFVAGPNFIAANPLVINLTNGRLKPGSPAIETGNSLYLFTVGSVPLIDADGLTRIKNGNPGSGGFAVDIGAYEAGDLRVLDTFKESNSHINTIESPVITALNNPKLQVTQNWNPNAVSGIFNNANIGVYNCGLSWCIFNQDIVSMTANAAFNVWNPAPSSNNFIHTATDGAATESSTLIDKSGLNGNPEAILSVTQLWDGVYNDNPVGAFYDIFEDKWRINNMNLVDMPLNAKFNVYYQTVSANAFEHRAVAENTLLSITFVDHPLLNETPCAQFQVTHVGSNLNPYPIGVYYDGAKQQWAIFNQASETMTNNAKFHVIVSAEQIAECSDIIFADGFE